MATMFRMPPGGPVTPPNLPHNNAFGVREHPFPDPITFAVSEKYLNRILYPRQATMLKCIFLRVDLLTAYDRRVIAEWEDNFAKTGCNGTPPGLIARMEYLKSEGHKWFRELILVLGRRAGKGYISALAMAYVLWCYGNVMDPQDHYGIDRDKRLTCLIYAGRKEQARDNLWRDLVNVIQGAPCFDKYISKPMGESLSVMADADLTKMQELQQRGVYVGLDKATFKIDPLPATPMSGRGGASFMIGFDEMAHMVATGANRSSDEVWKAATPALDQFGKDAFIVCPSSPYEMIGQFYQEWLNSQEKEDVLDPETNEPTGEQKFVYPEIFMLQLTSWDPYKDWENAHRYELFPEEVVTDPNNYYYVGSEEAVFDPKTGKETGETRTLTKEELEIKRATVYKFEVPRLQPLFKAIQSYDDQMKRLEKADPDTFAVERLSHWQTTLDAYLNPAKVAQMFDNELKMTTTGTNDKFYKGHGDPSYANDNFGLAVAHLIDGGDGYQHVVFDYIHHWDPANFPDHTIDYTQVTDEIWELIKSFPIDDFSFDQFQSHALIAGLTRKARATKTFKRLGIHVIHENATYNLSVAECFKIALNQGWIHAPFYEQADLELRFLQFKNNKVVHQTVGPVQHDDVARSMMEVAYHLLQKQVTDFMMGDVRLVSAPGGAALPHQVDPADRQVFNQFGRGRGGGSYGAPNRARGPFAGGRIPPGGRPPSGGRF